MDGISLFRNWTICFSTESCIFTSFSICKLRMKGQPCTSHLDYEEGSLSLGFRHVSLLWEGKGTEKHRGIFSLCPGICWWRVGPSSEQEAAESRRLWGEAFVPIIVSAWLRDVISTIRNELQSLSAFFLNILSSVWRKTQLLCHTFSHGKEECHFLIN